MPKKIPESDIIGFGIKTNHEYMENGETRFRLCFKDGTSFIRTQMSANPKWENSHGHKSLKELTLVQQGQMIVAEYIEEAAHFSIFNPGEWQTTTPGIPHNAILGNDTIVLSIKFGDCANPDWIACPELDALTTNLTFEQALEMVR